MYLTNQFYLHGGIEKILSQKINFLIDTYGYEVILCTSEHKNNPCVYPLHPHVKHIDLGVNYVRTKSYFHPQNLKKAVVHFKALKKTITEEQPDIVISVNTTPEQYFIPFIEKSIPKLKEFHSSGINFIIPKSVSSTLKHQLFKLFSRYDGLVVLNPDEKKYYPFKKLHVIPNFIKIAPQETNSKKENTIIAAGRIAPVKQFDHLIKAWSKIADAFPNWQVKIYGDGDVEQIQKLNTLIKKFKLTNIQLMGVTTHLHEEMKKAMVYAMTSVTECFPMVLLEAQAAGLAIISYDAPNGPRNIIVNNVSGILIDHNNILEFSETLKDLLNRPMEIVRLGQQAKVKVNKFSDTEIMGLWHKLFQDLIR